MSGIQIPSELIFDKQDDRNLHLNYNPWMYIDLPDLSRIRRFVNKKILGTLANDLVVSRLDYCNSLLASLTKRELNRLQRVKNTLCRVVTRSSRYSSITRHLKALHWLSV